MSYYKAPDYYRNPVPYLHSDIGAPVPGWGVNPLIAGPTMVGVGMSYDPAAQAPAVFSPVIAPTTRTMDQQLPPGQPPPPPEEEISEPLPWWIWPIGAAVVMGGVGYLGVKQGWL